MRQIEIVSKTRTFENLKEALDVEPTWLDKEVVKIQDVDRYYVMLVNELFGSTPIQIDLSNDIIGLSDASLFKDHFVIKVDDTFWFTSNGEWVEISSQPYVMPNINLLHLFKTLGSEFECQSERRHTISLDASKEKLMLTLWIGEKRLKLHVDQDELINVDSFISEIRKL